MRASRGGGGKSWQELAGAEIQSFFSSFSPPFTPFLVLVFLFWPFRVFLLVGIVGVFFSDGVLVAFCLVWRI